MTITFRKNNDLNTIKPGWPGNKIIRGRFANGEEIYAPSMRLVWRWKLSPNPQKAEKQRDHYCPPVLPDRDIFRRREDGIVWLGHATFLIRVQGLTFLTDPVLFDLPLIRRRVPLPCQPENFVHIDYLLLSHGHRDHLDARSLRLIFKQNPKIQAFGPLGMQKLVNQLVPGLPLQEAGWYQQFRLPAHPHHELFFLPAAHWHRRGLTDINQVLWGSFMLRSKDRQIYFAGDTALKEHFSEIKTLLGPPHQAIIPVGAYKPAFLMQQSHLNPVEAVTAFNQLGARTFIPMHYGTFDLSDEPAGEPVRLLQELAAAARIHGELVLPAIGELLKL